MPVGHPSPALRQSPEPGLRYTDTGVRLLGRPRTMNPWALSPFP